MSFILLKSVLSCFLVLGTTQQSNIISFIANTTSVGSTGQYNEKKSHWLKTAPQ